MPNKKSPLTGMNITPGSRPSEGIRKRDSSKLVFVGLVTDVSPDTNSMMVDFVDSEKSGDNNVSIPYPYTGPMGTMAVCPEVGALGLFIDTPAGIMPIGWLPPSLAHGAEGSMTERYPEDVSDPSIEHNRILPVMHRILSPGEVYIASSKASHIFMDTDVEIDNERGDEIRMRSGDGSIISTSLNNFVFSNGVWRSAGLIQRNQLVTTKDGEPIDGLEATRVRHSDGLESTYVGGTYEYNGDMYAEYRLEVEDNVTLERPKNDINGLIAGPQRNASMILSMGNYVGNDPGDPKTYGHFLAPKLFGDSLQDCGLDFKLLGRNNGINEITQYGLAYALHAPSGNFFFGADKEGQLHQFMGASTGTSAGISQSIVALGGKRERWGFESDRKLSWDALFLGGINWEVGTTSSNPDRKQIPRGVYIRSAGAAYLEYGQATDDKTVASFTEVGSNLTIGEVTSYGKIERIGGDHRVESVGKKEELVEGNNTLKVRGVNRVQVGGAYLETSNGDRSSQVMGDWSLNAAKQINITAGSREENFPIGSDNKTIGLGNRSTKIVAGNYSMHIAAGNYQKTILAGGHSDVLTSGAHTVSVGAGNYDVTVGIGPLTLNAPGGTVGIAASQTVTVSSLSGVDVVALRVNLGPPGASSGVLTSLNHPCFVTGAISPGSPFVSAT